MFHHTSLRFGCSFSFARAGELPLEVIRMKSNGVSVSLFGNTPGFTLPTNIGELGDGITTLDLSNCSLTGTIVCPNIHALYVYWHFTCFAGELPKELGDLVNLTDLDLCNNEFQGEFVRSSIHALYVLLTFSCFQEHCPRSSGNWSI